MGRGCALVLLALIAGCANGGRVEPPPADDAGSIFPDASLCASAACDPIASCDDGDGVAVCTCPVGYEGDGATCEDIDECARGTSGCDPNAYCANTDGWFDCACNPGFVGDGTACVDVDECQEGISGCDENAACTNTPGTFLCQCHEGFAGDGATCTDVNECADGSAGCHVLAMCENSVGGFACTCIDGYEGDGFTCADRNECMDGTAACDPNATCTNTVGSFDCRCIQGYEGDGATCADVNECARSLDDCDANATCTNTAGSFTCRCNTGYMGDGRTCVPRIPVCTVRETFERGTGWAWSPWLGASAPAGVLTSATRHDGTWALRDAGWHYRTDVSIGLAGDRIDAWAYTEGNDGRIYLGFAASSGGARSAVLAANSASLIIQENAGFGFTNRATAPFAFTSNRWYRIEVEFGASNRVTARVYDSDGTTLRATASYTFPSANAGGIALRAYNGLVIDTIRTCR